jgi:two-component system, NarL family, response regulator DevR
MRSDMPVARVLLVDEQEVVRRGVAKVLEGDAGIIVVGEARSVGEALRRGPAVRPDVVVVEMRLPDGSGADVCARLRARVPGLSCLVLSDSLDSETVHVAVRAGASGYLGKHVSGPALVAAVRRVASGDIVFDGNLAVALPGPHADGHGGPLEALTSQERAVLGLIAEGLSNREIGERLRLTPKTVKNYVTPLLSKLGLVNRTQAAVLATQLRNGSRDGETAA